MVKMEIKQTRNKHDNMTAFESTIKPHETSFICLRDKAIDPRWWEVAKSSNVGIVQKT